MLFIAFLDYMYRIVQPFLVCDFTLILQKDIDNN